MEASYQKYKGKINFVWVYGSEAHPEEYPFAKGFESTDLGWKHPYSITTKMAERAQRAKWMKTDPDPDLEIPMMIDYINDPPNKNNAIRRAYLGGGFYSGYVIDCDGKVLYARSWAWFAPGKDWWNLPLDPVANLHKLLDDYLKNPSSCYGKGGSADGGPTSGPDRGAAVDSAVQPDRSKASPDLGASKPGAGADESDDGCSVSGPGQAPPLALLLALSLVLRRRWSGRSRR